MCRNYWSANYRKSAKYSHAYKDRERVKWMVFDCKHYCKKKKKQLKKTLTKTWKKKKCHYMIFTWPPGHVIIFYFYLFISPDGSNLAQINMFLFFPIFYFISHFRIVGFYYSEVPRVLRKVCFCLGINSGNVQ